MNNDTIWKFHLPVGSNVIIRAPMGSRFLSAHNQDEKITVWAIVNSERNQQDYCFNVVGTGWKGEHLNRDNFLGTVLLENGSLVFHVFGPL